MCSSFQKKTPTEESSEDLSLDLDGVVPDPEVTPADGWDALDFEEPTEEDDLAERKRKEELRKRRFTIKRLIRLLHIGEPVQFVMSILGKR